MFLKTLGTGLGLAILAPRRLLAQSPDAASAPEPVAIGLAQVKKLRKVDGWMIVKVRGRQVLLVRDGAESVRAFDPTCTHQQCTVAYNARDRRFDCPCHGASYDLDGKPRDRLPKGPLKRYAARLEGEAILLDLEAAVAKPGNS
jgi:cytochrome b6-f complex iron-sulfur subunit